MQKGQVSGNDYIRSKLSFTFIANACGIFTGKEGSQILCDPWIENGVFEGSWHHFPPINTKMDDLKGVDAIYVSHLHPDHFDERYFDFASDTPLIVLDHGPNFLIRKLGQLGYNNLIKIKDGETVRFREFALTMYAPFAKHNFHEAEIGNLIDSALVVQCDDVVAINTNDNTPTVEAASMLKKKFGSIDLAMLNYNAAGPYPSCFDNLSYEEKVSEHQRILVRNFGLVKELFHAMQPKYLLPFAGAYVLGGCLWQKNEYLGTTTWDKCADWLIEHGIEKSNIVLLREGDTFAIDNGTSDRPYVPIDEQEMWDYVENEISNVRYPYQKDPVPDEGELVGLCEKASHEMVGRMERFGIRSDFNVIVYVYDEPYQIYPEFKALKSGEVQAISRRLECKLDERLLARILNRESHWNNAEIGAHISFFREPNTYEPDLHTGLQFFHK